VLGLLYFFSEAGAAPGSADVIACLTAHFTLVSMKIRGHLKKRDASLSDDEDAVDTTTGLKGGHRAQCAEQLTAVRHLLASQGAHSCSGLRMMDGEEPRRDDPSYRELLARASAAGNPPPALTAAPPFKDVMHTSGASVKCSVEDYGNSEEAPDADVAGQVEQETVAAAHAAVARAAEGVYQEVN